MIVRCFHTLIPTLKNLYRSRTGKKCKGLHSMVEIYRDAFAIPMTSRNEEDAAFAPIRSCIMSGCFRWILRWREGRLSEVLGKDNPMIRCFSTIGIYKMNYEKLNPLSQNIGSLFKRRNTFKEAKGIRLNLMCSVTILIRNQSTLDNCQITGGN